MSSTYHTARRVQQYTCYDTVGVSTKIMSDAVFPTVYSYEYIYTMCTRSGSAPYHSHHAARVSGIPLHYPYLSQNCFVSSIAVVFFFFPERFPVEVPMPMLLFVPRASFRCQFLVGLFSLSQLSTLNVPLYSYLEYTFCPARRAEPCQVKASRRCQNPLLRTLYVPGRVVYSSTLRCRSNSNCNSKINFLLLLQSLPTFKHRRLFTYRPHRPLCCFGVPGFGVLYVDAYRA